jgi:hypothetical protein
MVSSMDIKLNTNLVPVSPATLGKPEPRAGATGADSAQFDRSADLNQMLQNTPDIRPDAVEKAKSCLGDVQYPPAETLARIAALLAIHLDNTDSN